MICWKNMRAFPITINLCPLSYFQNMTLFTMLWENMGVYTFIGDSNCYNKISRWKARLLWKVRHNQSKQVLEKCHFGVLEKEEEATSSAAFFMLLFAAFWYALQSCALLLYEGSETELIFMHRENDLIARSTLPIFQKTTFARTFISAYSFFVFCLFLHDVKKFLYQSQMPLGVVNLFENPIVQ